MATLGPETHVRRIVVSSTQGVEGGNLENEDTKISVFVPVSTGTTGICFVPVLCLFVHRCLAMIRTLVLVAACCQHPEQVVSSNEMARLGKPSGRC